MVCGKEGQAIGGGGGGGVRPKRVGFSSGRIQNKTHLVRLLR